MTAQRRPALSANRRLQLVLLLMIAWETLLLASELTFGSSLFDVDGDRISGLIGSRGSFSGAPVIAIAMYGFCLTRGPLRHPGVLLVGVLEQVVAIVFGAYHVLVDHVEIEAFIFPLGVSLAFLALLIVNMPRGDVE